MTTSTLTTPPATCDAPVTRGRPDDGISDELLRQAVAGDAPAWNGIVRRYTPTVKRATYGLRLGDEVDDVVQATFLHLYTHADGIREAAALGGWLRTTARREALRIATRRAQERKRTDDLADGAAIPAPAHDLPESTAIRREDADRLRSAVEKLPERQRQLVWMLTGPDFESYQHISDTLGMPLGSIGPTRQRIVERLRRSLRDW